MSEDDSTTNEATLDDPHPAMDIAAPAESELSETEPEDVAGGGLNLNHNQNL